MRHLIFLLSAAALTPFSPVHAQSNSDAEGDASIIVTATRTDAPLSSIPAMVTVIGEEDVEQQLMIATDLQSVLAHSAPGFAPSRQKLTGFGESFRGRSPLYLIDGVPQSNPLRDGSRDGYTLDPIVIERIEVINGANAIQGLGATGGIVNYVTRSVDDDGWTGGVRAAITASDEFDGNGFEYRLGGYAGIRSGAFDILGAASWHSRGLFYDGRGRSIAVDDTQGDLADSDQRNLFAKIGWEPAPGQRLQLMINDFLLEGDGDFSALPGDRANGIPAQSQRGAPPGEPATNDVTTVSVDYTNERLLGGELTLQAYYQDFAATFGGGTFGVFQDPSIQPEGTLFDQSENRSEKLGARLTQRFEDIGSTQSDIILGVDFLRDETEQALIFTDRLWVPNTRYENFAPFLQASLPLLDDLTISGGLRYEHATLRVGDYNSIAGNRPDRMETPVEGGSPSFDDLLINGAVVYEFLPGFSIYASYNQGYTIPDVGRVLRAISVPGTSVEDILTLQPVVADNYEAGLTVRRRGLTAQLAYYVSSSDEGARLVADADGIFSVLREKTRVQGFEASIEAALGAGLRAGGNLSVLSGRVDTDDDGRTDADLDAINIGPDRLNLYLAWAHGPFTARAQSATVFDRDFSNAAGLNTANFDGYTLFDLYAGYDTGVGTVSFAVQNLADHQYIGYYSQAGVGTDDRYFSGRGRTFTLGWSSEF